jgi:hypothetical protein
MIISRKAVQAILEDLGFELEKLEEYIFKMLEGNENPNERRLMAFGKFKIHYSGHLSEKSINVTIGKKDLMKKCIGHFKVTSAGVLKV